MKEQDLTDLLKLMTMMQQQGTTNGIKLDVAAEKIAAVLRENALLTAENTKLKAEDNESVILQHVENMRIRTENASLKEFAEAVERNMNCNNYLGIKADLKALRGEK